MKPTYTLSLISVKSKLTLRFYKDGKAYKSRCLGLPATTEDISSPTAALNAVMAKYKNEFANAAYEYEINGKTEPYQAMFGIDHSIPNFQDVFQGTNFLEFTGSKIEWSDVDNTLLYSYRDDLENDGYSDNTRKKYMSDVKTRLDRSKDCGAEFPANNYAKILRGKKGTHTSIYLTKTELKQLSEVTVFTEIERATLVYFLLSAYTGCRFSDVIELNKSNIVFTDRPCTSGGIKRVEEIFYVSKKSGTPTYVTLKPIVLELLSMDITRVSNNQANQVLPSLCERAGITYPAKVTKADKLVEGRKCDFVTTHTARKSFATNCYVSGEKLRNVSLMMGHASIEITSSTYICCGQIEDDGVKSNYFD